MARIIAARGRGPREPPPQPLVGWTLALLAIALFASLGLLAVAPRGREAGDARRRGAGAVAARSRRPLAQAADPARTHGLRLGARRGAFDDRGPLLLDNQQRNGRAGVRVYRIFRPEQGGAAAGRPGLAAAAGDRRMPDVELPPGPHRTARPADAAAVRRPGAGQRRCGKRRRWLADDAGRYRRDCRAHRPVRAAGAARAAPGSDVAARLRARPGPAAQHAAAGTPPRLCGAMVRAGAGGADHRAGPDFPQGPSQ